MIYLDSSVVLARIFVETPNLPDDFWEKELVSSQLLQYEVWNRVHARGGAESYNHTTELLLGKVAFLSLTPEHLSRALKPFPLHLRTLDALHLATLDYLRSQGEQVELLSYDKRMLAAAQAMGIAVYEGP